MRRDIVVAGARRGNKWHVAWPTSDRTFCNKPIRFTLPGRDFGQAPRELRCGHCLNEMGGLGSQDGPEASQRG